MRPLDSRLCIGLSLASLALGCGASRGPRITDSLAVGRAPHGLRFTPNGETALLCESGDGTVAVLNWKQRFVSDRWPAVGAGEDAGVPLDLVSDGRGGYWITQFRSDRLLHVDALGRLLGTLQVPAGPSLFSARRVHGRVGLACEDEDRFLLFDPLAGVVVQEYDTGPEPYPPALTRDGILAFVPHSADGTVGVYDLLNWERLATVDVGGRPRGGALTVDDVSYIVATSDPDALVYINTASFEVEARVTRGVGPEPFSVCIPKDGQLGFVNFAGGSTLGVLDIASRRIVDALEVGGQPIAVREHPSGRELAVACEQGNRLDVVALATAAAETQSDPDTEFVPNEVVVLGMLHGEHETSAAYPLALVEELVRVIEPDVVCVEIPPNRMEAAQRGFREEGRLVEPRARRFPEYAQVLFPLQGELGLELVATAGWTEPMARHRRRLLERIGNDPARAAEWAEYEAACAAGDAAVAAGGGDDPAWIHTDAYDAAAELELGVYDRLFNDELGPGGWSNINRAHYGNIERLLDARAGEGLRVLVTYGAYHKGWFLRELRKRDDVRVLDARLFVERARAALEGPSRSTQAGGA